MIDFLETILAAKKRGAGWLVPVIFVAVYIISGIVKMKSAKREQQQGKAGQEQPKPRYKSLEDTTTARRQGTTQPRTRQLPYAKPAQQPRQVQPRSEPVGAGRSDIGPAGQRPVRPLAPQRRDELLLRPQRAVAAASPPVPARPVPQAAKPEPAPKVTIEQLRKKTDQAQTQPIPAQTPFASLSHLTETDNLRMAIVYPEILGKPLALREM